MGGRSDCRIFCAAGGLPLPTPDMWLPPPRPAATAPLISRDRAEGRGAPRSPIDGGEAGGLAGARVPAAAGGGDRRGGRRVGGVSEVGEGGREGKRGERGIEEGRERKRAENEGTEGGGKL